MTHDLQPPVTDALGGVDWDEIEGIVFDAVGTLIEPCPPVADAYALAASRQGIALATDEVKARFRNHFRADERTEAEGSLATDEATEARRWRRIVGNVLPELPDPGRAFEELWAHFAQPGAWRCFADVAPALDAARARGHSVCVASNFDGRLRTVAAGLEPLAGLRDGLVISSEVGFRKPHPAFYRAACEHLGRPGGRILWVGDDFENDVAAPIRAGLRGVWLDRHDQGGETPCISTLASLVSRR